MAKKKKPRQKRNLQTRIDDDVFAFANELAYLFGTHRKALEEFVRSSPQYAQWRRRVARCRYCDQWIVIEDNDECLKVLESHYKYVQGAEGKYPVTCKGSGTYVEYFKNEQGPFTLARINNHIQTILPGMLR